VRIVAGVDGCPRGWVAAVWSDAGVEWRVTPLAFTSLLDALRDAEALAIDVPIGYGPDRACDLLAKKKLGTAHNSVFLVPSKPVLHAASHAEACEVAHAAGEKGISVQTWNIGARIIDATEHADARCVEAHPEVSFLALAGRPLPTKHSAPGLAARMVALAPVFGDVAALLATAPSRARADDALDALACAWTARRVLDGEAEHLGGGPTIAY